LGFSSRVEVGLPGAVMERIELLRGLNRLRVSAILGVMVSLFSLVISSLPGGLVGGEGRLMFSLLLVGAILILGLILLVVIVAAWVYKVLGWSSMCKSGMRRFYCLTRLVVLVCPVVAVVLMIAGGIAIAFRLLSEQLIEKVPTEPWEIVRASPTGLTLIIGGIVALISTMVVEGVAILDLGMLMGERVLLLGAIAYLASTLLSAVGQAFPQYPMSTLSNAASLAAYILLAYGFSKARKGAEKLEAE